MIIRKLYTLVFIRKGEQVLLGLKKRGFGNNKWNGFGGKVEAHEEIVDAAARELKEECCIDVKTTDLKHIAHLEFTTEGDSLLMDVRVFSTNVFEGTPMETEEMFPKWYRPEDIPYNNMWPDDILWYPYMLKNKEFYAHFHYEGEVKILDYKIEELESLKAHYANRKLII